MQKYELKISSWVWKWRDKREECWKGRCWDINCHPIGHLRTRKPLSNILGAGGGWRETPKRKIMNWIVQKFNKNICSLFSYHIWILVSDETIWGRGSSAPPLSSVQPNEMFFLDFSSHDTGLRPIRLWLAGHHHRIFRAQNGICSKLF